MSIVLRGGEPPKLAGVLPAIIAAAVSDSAAGTLLINATGRYLVSYVGPAHTIYYAHEADAVESFDNNVQITRLVIDGQTIFNGQAQRAAVGFLHQFSSYYTTGNPGFASASSAMLTEGGFLVEESIQVWARFMTGNAVGPRRNIMALLSPIQ